METVGRPRNLRYHSQCSHMEKGEKFAKSYENAAWRKEFLRGNSLQISRRQLRMASCAVSALATEYSCKYLVIFFEL